METLLTDIPWAIILILLPACDQVGGGDYVGMWLERTQAADRLLLDIAVESGFVTADAYLVESEAEAEPDRVGQWRGKDKEPLELTLYVDNLPPSSQALVSRLGEDLAIQFRSSNDWSVQSSFFRVDSWPGID